MTSLIIGGSIMTAALVFDIYHFVTHKDKEKIHNGKRIQKK